MHQECQCQQDLADPEQQVSVHPLLQTPSRVATTQVVADVESLAARDIRAANVMGAPTPDKLTALAEQVASGALRIEIQRTFPLAEAAAALAAFQAGTRGKLVLVI